MPCNDGGQSEYYANKEVNDKLALALTRNDELARLLCVACASLIESNGGFTESLDRWYTTHLEHDRKRITLLLSRVSSTVDVMSANQLDELEKVLVNL